MMVEEAVEVFGQFVEGLDRTKRTVILHDSDADGVTAGVVLQRFLERSGFVDAVRVIPSRERDAWAPANRAKLEAAEPAAVFVLDLGSRKETLAGSAPVCLIDHHRPEGVAPGATLITGYHRDPIPNTSLMVYELCSSRLDMSDVEWVAAIGVLSDLGDKAPFEILRSVRERYRLADLKEATTLVNAARRASLYDPETAARALLLAESPAGLLASEGPEVASLRAAREEVRVAMNVAKKAAPVFAGPVALVRVSSRCQVHPVIAQIWRTRLPKYVVMVANDAYLPGRINFSMRASGDTNLLDFLGSFDLGDGEGSYGHGHDQATGGSLPPGRWNLLLEKMGFPESVFAPLGA